MIILTTLSGNKLALRPEDIKLLLGKIGVVNGKDDSDYTVVHIYNTSVCYNVKDALTDIAELIAKE